MYIPDIYRGVRNSTSVEANDIVLGGPLAGREDSDQRRASCIYTAVRRVHVAIIKLERRCDEWLNTEYSKVSYNQGVRLTMLCFKSLRGYGLVKFEKQPS